MNVSFQIGYVVYQILTGVAAVLVLPAFLLFPRGRRRIVERYGIWKLEPQEYIWFHGASVGEVNGLIPIMKSVRVRNPESKLLLTASSPTGLDRGQPFVDEVRLLPFDCIFFLALALRGVRFSHFIFGETELWPSTMRAAAQSSAKICMVNAAISDFTFPWYRRMRFLLAPLLKKISVICVAQDRYRERFVELGACENSLLVTGNTKYDCSAQFDSDAEIIDFKRAFFSDDIPVAVLGSVRPGEEQTLLDAVVQVRESHDLNVVIAPRHQEKFGYFAEVLSKRGIPFERRTELRESSLTGTVLLDTYGELQKVLAFADLAFIGGSLVDGIGGHNPIEAAINGAPVVMGPYYQNVTEPVEELKAVGGISIVHSSSELIVLLEACASKKSVLQKQAKNASEVVLRYRGITARVIQRIFEA